MRKIHPSNRSVAWKGSGVAYPPMDSRPGKQRRYLLPLLLGLTLLWLFPASSWAQGMSFTRFSHKAIIDQPIALQSQRQATITHAAISLDVVINEVYGGGGNSGAPYRNDFVELFNRGTTTVALGGWSIQYASATGTGNFGGNSVTALSGSLAPGQTYLIQLAGGTNGVLLPTPDATGTVNMSGSAGKVALVNSTTGLACNGSSTPCSTEQLAQIIDLVGWGNANFYETTAASGTNNTTSVARLENGCTETDNNSNDFAAGTPTPTNSSAPVTPCGVVTDTAPTVAETIPANGTQAVAPDANLTVTFNEDVNVTGSWFTLSCTLSGAHSATVSGGPLTFTLDPTAAFTPGDACSLTILAAHVTDQDSIDPPDAMTADVTVTFGVQELCSQPYTTIPAIQGSGADAAITGVVTTKGVVIGDYEGATPALRGFYLQDPVGDSNSATSDGIFVFNNNDNGVNLGDLVIVTGTASEFQGQTQLSGVTTLAICGTGSVTPVDITFPVPSATSLEQYEGMLVRLPQTLYVTEHFQLGRFGQVVMSANARLQQPTNVTTPGAAALALQAANDLNRIIIDDELNSQNPDPIRFARGGNPLSASNTLRGGDSATGIVGVLTYTWAGNAASGNAYRVRPTNALGGFVNFEPTHPRPTTAPPLAGTLRVAGMNLLNFFNTFSGCTQGVGGATTDCRGANAQAEFDRQWPKTVAAIIGTEADIMGINEIENDGYGASSAIQTLVTQLNAATAPGTYAFIDVDTATGQVNALGTDAIKVGLLYKPASVTPVGQTAALNSVAFVNGGDSAPRARPALAQAFQENASGERIVVTVNHFKSKGSACDTPDAGDGQGNCNLVRANSATALVTWLASDPTGTGETDNLIIGDLNSYAKEDPITVIENAGYTNLIATFLGPDAYSYVFDGQWGYLDHALASATLLSKVAAVSDWHINADEPSVLDYNTDFKTANLQTTLYAPDVFRIADHDPVLVDLALNAPPVLTVESPQVTVYATQLTTNTGTLSHANLAGVTLAASVGTVTHQGNGQWHWSFTPTTPAESQVVTITATDSTGASSSVTFTLTVNALTTNDFMRLQFLNGLLKKFIIYQGQKEFILIGCPYIDVDHPNLLEITASGDFPCQFVGRQRLGVYTFGEFDDNIDTVRGKEALFLKLGNAPSVAGRKWVAAQLRIDGTNAGATVRVTFYDGATQVGETTVSQVGVGEHVVSANGRLFNRIKLSAVSGRFGLKGFTNAAIFYFPDGINGTQAEIAPEPPPTAEELAEGAEWEDLQFSRLFLPLITQPNR
ncbi:MAG: ExeM/NucH family extracellular endonuclease [Caldilineaceae bacterium]|nr:ExeM/NucH family extracellular endonuclease [Caldilineaceae bacterium]